MILNIKNKHINFEMVMYYYIDDPNIVIKMANGESIIIECVAMSQAIAIVDRIDLVLGVPRLDTIPTAELDKFLKK